MSEALGICLFVNRNIIGCHVDIGKESLQQQLKDQEIDFQKKMMGMSSGSSGMQ